MLVLLVVWLFLGICCWCLGTLLLEFCCPNAINDQSDRFFISQWLGIVILCNLLLVISFFTPLTASVGLTVWLVAIATVILWRRTRLKIKELLASIDRRSVYISVISAILVGIFASIPTIWYDTGLYHYQVIKWLANFGTVPGLGLLYYPFALPATFFTISAVLEHSILTNRATGSVVGFITLIFIVQFLSSVNKIITPNQKKCFSDYFLATYSGYSLISMCIYGFTILKSTSPDVIVAFMSGIPLWLMIMYQQNRNQSLCIIAVLLASGLVSFKWSALVILVIVYTWAVFNSPKNNFQEFIFNTLLTSVIAFLPLIPTLSYGFITSGCPLFPSGILCMDVPWGVGKLRAEEVKQMISNWQKWATFVPPDPSPWSWLIPWAQREAYAVFQICISLTCGFLIWFQSPKKMELRPISKYVLSMGLGGIVYAIVLSPTIRFIIGYVNIICVFWLAQFASLQNFIERQAKRFWIVLVFLWVIPIIYFPVVHDRKPNLFLPEELPQSSQLGTKQAIDFSYLVPQNDDRCWSADLPCTPENLDRVRLLNPDRGIGGGFRRAD